MLRPELNGLPPLQTVNGFRVVFQYPEIEFAIPKHLAGTNPYVFLHDAGTVCTETQLHEIARRQRFGIRRQLNSFQMPVSHFKSLQKAPLLGRSIEVH